VLCDRYNRHVYQPFRSPNFVLPWLNCDEQGAPNDAESPELPAPSHFYRRLVEDYMREADHHYNFNVYKIEGWSPADALALRGVGGKKMASPKASSGDKKEGAADDKAEFDTLIPFMLKCEIGFMAHLEKIKANPPKGYKFPDAKTPIEEMIKEKRTHTRCRPPARRCLHTRPAGLAVSRVCVLMLIARSLALSVR
jgi:hypothetical protein